MASGFDEPQMVLELEAEFDDMPVPPATPKTTLDAATGIAAAIVDNYTPAAGITNHADLSNLPAPADDHTQYGVNAGRAGGQVRHGGINSGDNSIQRSTSHATKGDWKVQGTADADTIILPPSGIHSLPKTIDVHAEGTVSTSLTYNVWTEILFNSVQRNVGGEYNFLTGRFTPSVAGSYLFTWCVGTPTLTWPTTGRQFISELSRNGSRVSPHAWYGFKYYNYVAGATVSFISTGAMKIYLDPSGTPDYASIWGYQNANSPNAVLTSANGFQTYLSIVKVA